MPFSYYIRSTVFQVYKATSFEPCENNPLFAVCVNSTDGLDVLDGLGRVLPLVSSEDETGIDLVVLVAIGLVYKILYVVGVVYKTGRSAAFHEA